MTMRSRRADYRQLYEARLPRSVINTLHRPAIISGHSPEYIRHERLRITVVQREPARLYLHHDPVAGQKHVVGRGQGETVQQRLIGGDCLGSFQTLAVAAAKNVG